MTIVSYGFRLGRQLGRLEEQLRQQLRDLSAPKIFVRSNDSGIGNFEIPASWISSGVTPKARTTSNGPEAGSILRRALTTAWRSALLKSYKTTQSVQFGSPTQPADRVLLRVLSSVFRGTVKSGPALSKFVSASGGGSHARSDKKPKKRQRSTSRTKRKSNKPSAG